MRAVARTLLFGAPAFAAAALAAYGYPYRDRPSEMPVPGEAAAAMLGLVATLGPALAAGLPTFQGRIPRMTIAGTLGAAAYAGMLVALDSLVGWF